MGLAFKRSDKSRTVMPGGSMIVFSWFPFVLICTSGCPSECIRTFFELMRRAENSCLDQYEPPTGRYERSKGDLKI